MKKICLTLIAIFVSICGYSQRLYIDGFAGVNFVTSFKDGDARIYLNSGYIFGLDLGYRFSRFFMTELEVAYRHNTFDHFTFQDVKFSASGSIKMLSTMANGIIELPFRSFPLTPYFGGGIGSEWNWEDFTIDPFTVNGVTHIYSTFKKSGNGLIYQGMVGLIFSSSQKTYLSVEYRYVDGAVIHVNHTLDAKLKTYF